jgi:2-oxoglutarate ferredoxin oxidoreductase subunit alpha
MVKDVFTFLVGGKAGEGVKKAGSVVAQIFISKGLQAFQMDDYMSLIRGGHNFTIISTANRWISSQYLKADLIVNFDRRSYETHKNHLREGGIMVYNSDKNEISEGIGIPMTKEAKPYPRPDIMLGVGAVAILAAAIGFTKKDLEKIIENEYPSGIKDNISYANRIYDLIFPKIGKKFQIPSGDKKRPIIYGNYAIALGAIAGGLDIYYAYPMTPASTLLHYLASLAPDFKLAVIQPENEIAVINMAIGSTFAGAKSMVGTSGGGFALMTEGFSLAGMVEAPVLCVLSMRPGPATGVPTYTGQGDLNFAINVGHGEFLRIVASPGTIEEAYYLTTEMLNLVWMFQTPGILLTDMHLSECSMTVDLDIEKSKWAEGTMHTNGSYKRYVDTKTGVSPLLFPPSKELIKWNSHEHDEFGITTENPEMISKMHEKRFKKFKYLEEYLRKSKTVNVYGDKGPILCTYGSTTMSVLEAVKYGDINARVIQPIFLSPFPVWELQKYENEEFIVVEQSVVGQFSNLLKEKGGIRIKAEIKQYNGRPFDPIELSEKIKEVL